jgi:hypothetical protein
VVMTFTIQQRYVKPSRQGCDWWDRGLRHNGDYSFINNIKWHLYIPVQMLCGMVHAWTQHLSPKRGGKRKIARAELAIFIDHQKWC